MDDQSQGLPRRGLAVQPSSLSEPTGLVIDDGALAREVNQGWWSKYEDLWIAPLIGMETQASRISSYESSAVPWMFQTEDYARAVIRGAVPGISDRVLADRVNARIKRQELLTRESGPVFLALVDESALHKAIGGSQVMRHQLKRMVEVASTVRNVTLQVVPKEAGAHPALDNTFTLLEFPAARPAMVYVEIAMGTFYLEEPAIVDRYQEILRYLIDRDVALDPKRSMELIDEIGNSPGLP